MDAGRLAIWLVLLVAIFVPLEQLGGLHPTKIWRKQIGVDLTWYFINSLLPAAVLSVPLALVSRAMQGWNPGGFYSAVASWPFWLKLILVLLVNDIGAYWGHRAMHFHPMLRRFHALHHSAEEMDWLVNTRAHPFDTIFVRFAGLAPVYLLGSGTNHRAAHRPGGRGPDNFRHGLDVFHSRQHADSFRSAGMADFLACLSPLAPHQGRSPGPQFRLRFSLHRQTVRHGVAAEALAVRLWHQRPDADDDHGPILRSLWMPAAGPRQDERVRGLDEFAP